MEKLYLVLRGDLTPGQMLPQTGHGLRSFIAAHPKLDAAWHEYSKNLVVLTVPDEKALWDLYQKAKSRGAPASYFREPDLNNSMTCVGLGLSEGGRLVGSLPLALRDRKKEEISVQS